MKDPAELTLTEVAGAIRRGKLSSVELTHWAIDRIPHWKALNAFVRLEPEVEVLERDLEILLLPKDPNDEKNIILEIRKGAGGDEAVGEAPSISSRGGRCQTLRER